MCAIDFSKAFDHINHTTAIEKLIQLGVNRSLLPTICSFLSQRSQTVRFHGFTTTSLNLTCGVPQGPIIFSAMVNDAAITLDKHWKYVDVDFSLVEIVTKREPSGMQSHINALVDWCSLNDNETKPREM